MDIVISIAKGFIGLFNAGGKVFMSYMTGIIPLLIALITAINALIKIIGEERVNKFMAKLTKFSFLRYLVLPFLGDFFFTNPMCYTAGRFLPEKYKPAYIDASASMLHPITGLFPHANSAELFVFLGIANGFAKAGGDKTELALYYLIVGFIVIWLRGVITERVSFYFFKKDGHPEIITGGLDVDGLQKANGLERA